MIHKISLKGYTTGSPFKLFYFADEEGISDLVEAYYMLLILPLTENISKANARIWASSPYYKKREDELAEYNNSWWPGSEKERLNHTEGRAALTAKLDSDIATFERELEPIIERAKALLVPININSKTREIRYLVNSRNMLVRKAVKLELELQESIQHKSWGGWYLSQIQSGKANILNSNQWARNFKIIQNGELKKHPCVLCPRALESLEGLCAFGGGYCSESLTKLLRRDDNVQE